ncbi:ELMO/CED-12 family protein [Talaromyces stipitatus ATCC 10500]|uniref:ELMO/CED-12 family protein n=1 Tax=Talaromyces stipitatus (strain ATCC 10500 / CBS 375.48 / QM 6759 / NRRL 1006) TaxID=441959 RepID=B8MG81_TALSN|nr:ELMO/CED-12 family protein [Talaromyces stipitatus ATCC 10500]EED15948.1 ELMO/CED-12 family protein [Talaromyces stipitatus ATCC 10500]
METLNPSDLVNRLGSDEDAVRKMAAFKLQGSIGDPSFADIFIAEGGLSKLRYLTLTTAGNTLAYSLTSFARLLEVDKGWEYVDEEVVERIVHLIVTHPLVNILRGAMAMLVSIVSHPHSVSQLEPEQTPADPNSQEREVYGFRALKPAIDRQPQFLEMLVSRLSSADHALCANALQLINSLMRDSITNDEESEWPKFIKKLQDLGVIRAVYILMQGSALQDHAHPLIEFQSLTKLLLRKWKNVAVDLEKPDHRRALKGIHLASNPEKKEGSTTGSSAGGSSENGTGNESDMKKSRRHNPEKWRRLGFQSESPAAEFHEMGFLGMMDLTDYVRKHQDDFQKMLLEHSTKPAEQRCPIARASLAVTSVLYEHFEVEKSATDDAKNYLVLESRSNFDKVFKPLLLHWSRIHVAALHAFFRLWKATSAEVADFDKIVELVRILVESVVGGAPRTKDVQDVEEELDDFEYQRLRELQMELLELTYEDAWGQHLRQVRDELQHEALQFVKEQRIRCLLQGAWFPNEPATASPRADDLSPVKTADLKRPSYGYKYVQLSHNRRYLHFSDFDSIKETAPVLDSLSNKIDLSIVSSVVSNVSASSDDSSGSTIKTTPGGASSLNPPPGTSSSSTTTISSTKITIHGYAPTIATSSSGIPRSPNKDSSHTRTGSRATQREIPLLTLRPQSHSIASEWLDGLLMLLNQQPITAETNKLVNLISNYGLKIRLLNVRFDDAAFAGETPKIPSREGLDEDYYYDVFGGV